MTNSTIPRTNFLGGQIGPFAFNRVDTESHASGCELIENFKVMAQGPVKNREGTRFVSPVKDHTKKVRLFPFVFSTEQAYILEFGNLYMRVYKDRGQLLSGGDPYEIVTPYLEAELDDIQFTQSADVMYIAHENHKPRKLTRSGHTSWTLVNYAPTADPFTAAGDYPRAVCLYEERLVWAGTNNKPQTIRGSKSADYENMTVGTNDADGYAYTISSEQVNVIRWLFSDTLMLAGTVGGIFVARGSGLEEAITPSNVFIRRHVGEKVASDKPILVQDAPLFTNRSRKKVFGLGYSDNTAKYKAAEISFKANGMLGDTVKQMAWQNDPDSIVWMVRGDGRLMGITVELTEQVVAWHTHRIGGEGIVESLAVIPEDDGDELWLVVRRVIDGQTVRYIEFMENRYEDEATDFFFVDSGLTYEGSPTDTIAGLDHLEGREVTILADGGTHPKKTVLGGEIELEREASKVTVGLGYESTIILTTLGQGAQDGSALGHKRRVAEATFHLLKTVGLMFGESENDMDEMIFRDYDDEMDTPLPIFTGERVEQIPGGFNDHGRMVIKQVLPMPCTILGITPRYEVSEG